MKTLALTLLISLASITLQAKEPNWKKLESYGISKQEYIDFKKQREIERNLLLKKGYEKQCFLINRDDELDSAYYYEKLLHRTPEVLEN